MKSLVIKLTLILLSLSVFIPGVAIAHEPRLVGSSSVIDVSDPEISKAYYGTLAADQPQLYKIISNKPFNLYVNILLPVLAYLNADLAAQNKNISVNISKLNINNSGSEVLVNWSGASSTWTKFWEPFGRDWYYQGPEYRAQVSAGTYEIRVVGGQPNLKYALAIGETEFFNFTEGLNAIKLIPQIKTDFFNESPAGFIFSPFGYGYVVVLFMLSFIFGFLYRYILRFYELRSRKTNSSSQSIPLRSHRNINTRDRVWRAVFGLALFSIAIATTWSGILIFISGFCFFEAIFSWCGFYAAIGVNTCPTIN